MSQICYYGDKLSTNMALTPEGFLVCRNVPIARTGYQQYLESELIEDGNPNELVNVYRSPNEVFSTATLASFEGKPVTDGHPSVDVTPANYRIFSKGHVQHVRVGRGEDADKILADLYITDQSLIDEIRNNGKREVSAGYYAEDKEDSSGRLCQTKIRGNHVAVVDEGRAGRSVCIRDSKGSISGGKKKMDDLKRKQKIALITAQYLCDASPKDVLKRMADAAEVLAEEVLNDEAPEMKEDKCDEEPEMKEDKCDEEPEEKKDEDVMASEEEIKSDEDVEMDVVSDEDEIDETEDVIAEDEDVEESIVTADAAIKSTSKAAMKIKDKNVRLRVQKAILDAVRGKSQMPGIMQVTKKVQDSHKLDSRNNDIDLEALQKVYDKLNPHKDVK